MCTLGCSCGCVEPGIQPQLRRAPTCGNSPQRLFNTHAVTMTRE